MMRKLLSIISVIAIIICIGLMPDAVLADTAGEFGDVTDPSKPYYKPVYWAVQQGITVGYKNGNFGPDDACTRAQFVTFIWRLAGKPEAEEDASFSDVTSDMSAYRAISWATEQGIIVGYKDGTFRPGESVLRRQVATMLWRMAGRIDQLADVVPFSDVEPGSSYYNAVVWGGSTDIIKGSNGRFMPDELCFRRQIATFLYRYVRYTESDSPRYYEHNLPFTGWKLIGGNCCYYSNGYILTEAYQDGLYLDSYGIASGEPLYFVPVKAKVLADYICDESMTKEEKLRTVFDYVQTEYRSTNNPRIPHYTGLDWIYVYANDMLGERGGGNCMSYAATFAFLAKAVGYDEVYACNTGPGVYVNGLKAVHAWTEIDGKVYDPEQYHDTSRKIYGLAYDDPTVLGSTIMYWGAISDWRDHPYKRLSIPPIHVN